MAESLDSNGTARPLQDVTGDGFVAEGDKHYLIDEEQPEDLSPGPASPVSDSGQRSEISPLQMDSPQAPKKTSEGLKIIIISCIAFSISVTVALVVTIFLGPPPVEPHGAVVCDVQECSTIGTNIMKKGGSAVDSAIATVICMGVTNPHHSGVGGGALIMVRQVGKNVTTMINARERAPSGVNPELYDPTLIRRGGMAVAVPSELRGLQAAYNQFGSLPWKDLVLPSVNLARTGFPITGSLAHAIDSGIDPQAPEDAALRDLFFHEGSPMEKGETLTMQTLADTLQYLAENGVDAFYEKYSTEMVDAVQQSVVSPTLPENVLSVKDIKNYEVASGETITQQFGNMTIDTMPAPGGGPLLLFVLNVLHGYSLSRSDTTDPLYYHRLVETLKFMNAERFRFGDPQFNDLVYNNTEEVISKEYADTIRNLIDDDKTHNPQFYLRHAGVTSDQGTAHVSVISPKDDMVSITSTVNNYFGSHIVTSPGGIILNNEMADFNLPNNTLENTYNQIEGNKQPLSSMTPSFAYNPNKPCSMRIAIGGTNGSRIISGVAEVLVNLLSFKMNVSDAVEAPRLYNPLIPDSLEHDENFPSEILTTLEQEKGHSDLIPGSINIIHVAAKINETLTAVADTSREGDAGASVF